MGQDRLPADRDAVALRQPRCLPHQSLDLRRGDRERVEFHACQWDYDAGNCPDGPDPDSDPDAPERIDAMAVTPSFFRLLRVPAERGRTFTEAEGEIGNEKKAVLSYAFWKERYGTTDPIGQSVRVSGEPYTIVGVMPRDFAFQDAETQLFVPLRITPDMRTDERRHSNSWQMLGRLESSASVEQAQAQIDAVNASNLERFPNFREILNDAGFHTVVANYQNDLIRDIKSTLYLLQVGVLMILLIGCVNIANLIMVRSTGRSRELATRAALGDTAGIDDLDQIEKLIVDTVGRHLDRAYRRAPLITAVVIDA